MASIIQAVVLHCPTALVWNHSGEGKVSSHLIGSPLDHLPIPPSMLPMAPRFSNEHVRSQIVFVSNKYLILIINVVPLTFLGSSFGPRGGELY